jgi:hypothetical protein
MKALRAGIMIALVLGLVAFGAASLWLGSGIKAAVTTYGPRILGAPVALDAVILTPWSGKGMIKGLEIGNPPGFKGPRALRVGSVELTVKLASLATDTIVVESLVVREPELAYELGPGGSNFARLQKNAEAAAGSPAPSQAGGAGKSLFIRELRVNGGKVGVSAAGQGMSVSLPPVALSNLGGKGRTPAQAAAEVMRAITGSATKAVSNLGGKALEAAASGVLGKLGGLLKKK